MRQPLLLFGLHYAFLLSHPKIRDSMPTPSCYILDVDVARMCMHHPMMTFNAIATVNGVKGTAEG